MVSDHDLIDAAVDVATAPAPEPSVLSLMRAVASTREQTHRQQLAEQARQRVRERVGEVSAAALEVLRLVFLVAL